MLYRKNVPGVERAIRVIAGLAMAAGGVALLGHTGSILLIVGGAVAVATGFFGFCPACAMVGRRLMKP